MLVLSRVFVICVLTSSSATASAATYKVTFNDLTFGEMQVELSADDKTYSITATAQAKGFLGMILRSRYEGQAEGKKMGGALRPDRFYVKSDRVFKHRRTEIVFEDGRPTAVTLTPLKDHTELTDPTKVTDARIDSLSGLFALFSAEPGKCVGPLALYDGRRLLSVTFNPPTAGETVTTCQGYYAIDRGPDHSIQKGQRSFDLVFTYDPKGGAPRSVEVISGGNTVRLDRQDGS